MKSAFKILKWLTLSIFAIFIFCILLIRFGRLTDKLIYKTGNNYDTFESVFNYDEFYFEVEKDVKIHAVLFKTDSLPIIGTIFHHLGNGMTLMNAQNMYQPLLDKGFQIFAYERRGFAKSNGIDDNSLVLKMDALYIFDQFLELENIKNTDIIIWGQSLGGAFATLNASERQDKIKGLVLEGTFNSFPDIGKFYAKVLHLENFKWLMPLLMNNDFPAEIKIKTIKKPTFIIHSISDEQVPFDLGQKLYNSSNKANTVFWKIDGKHINGIKDYEKEYLRKFIQVIEE